MRSSGGSLPRRLVLDTSAYTHLRKGHPPAHQWVGAAEAVYLPATVLGELEGGFRLGRRADENRVALAEFLAEPFVHVVPVDREIARRYGELFANLRRAGTPVPVNDIWIAAATIELGAHLLTFDTDFQRVPRIDCTVLPPPR